MKSFKKLIAKVLIVSMILTSHSLFTYAEGMQELVTEKTTVVETGTVDYSNNVESNENVEPSENVGASLASHTDADEEDGEHINDDVEEPEEDETTVEETTIVEETTTSVEIVDKY